MDKVTLYVKKIWSYDPDKYKYIEIDKALGQYVDYIYACNRSNSSNTSIKVFSKWLDTEI